MAKPEIRLKGFEGEWKKHSLKEKEFTIIAGGDIDRSLIKDKGKYPVIANALSNEGVVGYYDNYYRIKAPAVSVTGRGEIGYAKARKTSFTPVVRLLSIESFHDVDFLANAINCHKTIQESTGVPQLTTEKIAQYEIAFPKDIEEEKAIGYYILSIDTYIQSTTKKMESLKQMKQACLVSMFPQTGETTPRVRFKGFEGKWGYSSLGEIFEERVESNIYGEMLSVTMNNGVIKASENGRFDNSNSDKSKYKVVKVNDIAYNSMRMWQGASGCSQYEGIVSPAYTVVVPCEGIDSLFFSYIFKTLPMITLFRLHSQGLTSDTWNLKYPAFSKIKVIYPKEIQEQQRIASYFRSLDKQISLQEKRLEKLKQIKAACLDKMFV